MSPSPLIAIFGAAVLPHGPSPSLLRRIGYGWQAAQAHPGAQVLCSGGVGRHGPSEASVMAERLAALGLAAERLILDEESLDTLQSAGAVARWRRRLGAAHVVVCSDAYHVPRIRLLLGALGTPSVAGPRLPGRGGAGLAHWTRMSLREGLAIPYDLALAIAQRRRLAGLAPTAS